MDVLGTRWDYVSYASEGTEQIWMRECVSRDELAVVF